MEAFKEIQSNSFGGGENYLLDYWIGFGRHFNGGNAKFHDSLFGNLFFCTICCFVCTRWDEAMLKARNAV